MYKIILYDFTCFTCEIYYLNVYKGVRTQVRYLCIFPEKMKNEECDVLCRVFIMTVSFDAFLSTANVNIINLSCGYKGKQGFSLHPRLNQENFRDRSVYCEIRVLFQKRHVFQRIIRFICSNRGNV